MGLSLYNLFKAGLLGTNAVIILNRERPDSPVVKYGYHRIDPSDGASLRNKIAGFLEAIAYLKVPVIAVNCVVILLELLIGG
jgi:immediate early response 3-interacting protein 1